ncbi:putative trans-sialidase, Group II [Trypanosoma cruzi]|nr:putative trans-sialidase, Group II [Trypanosoma cruzi]
MIVQCKDDQSLFDSRDMGATWTRAIGTLSGVWTNSRLGVFREYNLPVGAPIIANIEGVKVMLYTWEGCFWGEKKENVFHLLVMENNRTFSVGSVAMDNNLELFHALLYSSGALYFLQESGNVASNTISLVPLTEGLQMINYVLKSWAQLDSFFSELFTPTAGLVGFLSNALSGGDTWIDDYLCVNAIVTKNAMKVKDGF